MDVEVKHRRKAKVTSQREKKKIDKETKDCMQLETERITNEDGEVRLGSYVTDPNTMFGSIAKITGIIPDQGSSTLHTPTHSGDPLAGIQSDSFHAPENNKNIEELVNPPKANEIIIPLKDF